MIWSFLDKKILFAKVRIDFENLQYEYRIIKTFSYGQKWTWLIMKYVCIYGIRRGACSNKLYFT